MAAMTDNDRPWEPPLAGTEAEHLVGALDRLRTTFRWKAAGLKEAGLQHRLGVSTLTLAGLLKHLALVEDLYSTSKLRGESPGQPWEDVDWDADPDWEFSSGPTTPPPSSTPCGTGPSGGPGRGSPRPSPMAAPSSPSTRRTTRDGTPACAGCCAT